MTQRDAQFLCQATGGERVFGPNRSFDQVSIDTRTLEQNSAFFCLVGPRFDAHAFVEAAVEKGAVILVVLKDRLHELPTVVCAETTIIAVDDTEAALAQAAAAWRTLHDVTVVALTGSSGKTTTKEMVAAILSADAPTLATSGNLNNHLGVPLTLLRLREEHRFAVIEMGMNAPGEIDFLCQLASPDFGVVTTVGEAHTEGVGSIVGVARAKGELFRALDSTKWGVFPSHVAERDVLCNAVDAPLDTIGSAENDTIRVKAYRDTPGGLRGEIEYQGRQYELTLPMTGLHNLHNACLALAVGRQCAVDIDVALRALSTVEPPPMRGEIKHLSSGAEVVLDCYNANPQSMRAAVSTFVERHPKGVLALGDMLELGDHADEAHAALGAYIADTSSTADLIGIGELSRHMVDGARKAGLASNKAHWCVDATAAIPLVQDRCTGGRALLIKGSRGMRMERIWNRLSQLGRA